MSHAFEGFKSLQKIAVTLNHYKDFVFENWATGQPDNKRHDNGLVKNAAVLYTDGSITSWHDYKIDDELEFVCLYTEYLAVPGKKVSLWRTFGLNFPKLSPLEQKNKSDISKNNFKLPFQNQRI